MEPLTSLLLPAITETVFGSLAEATGLSDWLRQRLGRDPEKLAFQHALTQALTDATQTFPGRDLRYFAEVLRDVGGPLLARTMQPAANLPTADELTQLWLTHLTIDSAIHYRQEFERFAVIFLERLFHHIENQQPLQWIVQARRERANADDLRRIAEASQSSAATLAALKAALEQDRTGLEEVVRAERINIATGGSTLTGSNVMIGSRVYGDLTIKNYFIQGLPRLVIDYSSRIQDFLLEYLGSKRKRVPFGGRQQQLDELHAWLDDHTAPPYYLMSAEAGRGKSALVCRWLAQLTTCPDLNVIFVPISIRFETATQDVVFAALAARLAKFYGEDDKLNLRATAGEWKIVCEIYLRRKPPAGKNLLVILDGLDEATGWTAGRTLFSSDPPEGLRVMVTARTRPVECGTNGWATTLGWEDGQLARTTTLIALDRRGVEEVFVSIGNPLDKLAKKIDVVGELHRLSEGDPLLVRLYVDALVAEKERVATLQVGDLHNIKPGLAGYFERWWQDQQEQWRIQGRDPIVEQANLRTLLNVIAAAMGPLMLDDLAALYPDLADSMLVRWLIQQVSRWLVGDGKTQGYSYSHPRLGYYFWEQLNKHEQKAWNERFVGWGARILAELNAEVLAPERAPRYLLQHYADHLERSNAPAESFYALISNGWRKAWEVEDVSYGGFLNDVDRTWNRASLTNPFDRRRLTQTLIQQVRSGLCKTSVATSSSNMPSYLLTSLVTHKLRTPTQALAIIKLMSDEKKQVLMLRALVKSLPVESVGEVLNIAHSISRYDCSSVALAISVPYLTEKKQEHVIQEALDTARLSEDIVCFARVFGEVAPYMNERDRSVILENTLCDVRALGTAYDRCTALNALMPYLSDSDRKLAFKELLNLTRAFGIPPYGESMPTATIAYLSESQKDEYLNNAIEIARSVKIYPSRAKSLAMLLPYLNGSNQRKILLEALSTARPAGTNSSSIDALILLAPYLTSELLDMALQAVSGIWNEFDRARVLGALVPHLPQDRQLEVLERVLTVVRTIGDWTARNNLLQSIVSRLPDDLIRDALITVCKIEREDYRADALQTLAPHLPTNLLNDALTAARSIVYERSRAESLFSLASRLPDDERQLVLEEALIASQAIPFDDFRVTLLGKIRWHLYEYEREKIIEETLTNAYEISDVSDRARALIALVPNLLEKKRLSVTREVLICSRKIKYQSTRIRVYVDLCKCLAGDERKEVLEDALKTVSEMDYSVSQANALVSLAPYFSADLLQDAMRLASSIKYEYGRCNALNTLAAFLPRDLVSESLQHANDIGDQPFRISILCASIPSLQDGERGLAIKEVLESASSIDFSSLSDVAIGKLIPYLSVTEQGLILETYLINLARTNLDGSERGKKLEGIAPYLAEWASLQPEQSYRSFAKALRLLAERPRSEFLNDLSTLMPFILSIAGNEASNAVAGIFRSVQEVCEWWP